jgi:short-chain 2-methylacyl-CoA dehydrogenase
LARVDSSVAITLSAGVGLGANPIYSFGTAEQKQQFLPDMCAGRSLGAFGLTEPDAGSDASATKTRAVFDSTTNEWVINGAKEFITNSGTPITSVVTITAKTDDGISAFLIPAGTKGFTVEPAYQKMGWHASDTHPLSFADCRIPKENMLGESGGGVKQFLSILDDGRVAIAALAVGLAQGCLDESLKYANDRVAFGSSIASKQIIAARLADMAVSIEAARLLTYQAAWLKDTGKPFSKEAAIAKVFATEKAIDVARSATQIFGGYGFIDETPVARHYRDAKILEIGEGTSEIQRIVIARHLGVPVSM